MKALLFFYILTYFSLNANELHWVDEQIKAIKPPRVGLKPNNLLKIKDPFIFAKSNDSVKKKSVKSRKLYRPKSYKKRYSLKKLHLSMTMNKSAKINGKWYKIDDKIHGYKIVKVDLSKITLSYHKKNYLLSTYSKHKNLNFKNK